MPSKKFVLLIYLQEQLVKKLRGHNKTHIFRKKKKKHFTIIQKIKKRKSKAKEISFKATARVQAKDSGLQLE